MGVTGEVVPVDDKGWSLSISFVCCFEREWLMGVDDGFDFVFL